MLTYEQMVERAEYIAERLADDEMSLASYRWTVLLDPVAFLMECDTSQQNY